MIAIKLIMVSNLEREKVRHTYVVRRSWTILTKRASILSIADCSLSVHWSGGKAQILSSSFLRQTSCDVSDKGDILFSKLDIKDDYWRMSVRVEDSWNFTYVLPNHPGQPVEIVVPTALQMGWTESPLYLCAATETGRNIVAAAITNTTIKQKPHPLEHYLFPPKEWSEETVHQYCVDCLHGIEVYIDDFIAFAQTTRKSDLVHISRSLLNAINNIFPPREVTGHPGEEPIAIKKLEDGDGIWASRKEILGWIFNGATRGMELAPTKVKAIKIELRDICCRRSIPLQHFEKIVGKLCHVTIGLPARNSLCQPFNRAVSGCPKYMSLGKM